MVHTLKPVKFKNKILNVNIEKYDNIDEFYKTLEGREQLIPHFSKSDASSYSFCHTNSYDEAVDLLYHGYKEALEDYKNALKIKTNSQKKMKFKNDVVGFQPIVPNAIMGLPLSMINSHYTVIKTPVIDIYYDTSFTCGTSTDTIINTGRKLLNVILNLESMGYKINLYCCLIGIMEDRCPNDMDICCIKLKDSNRPLDINRITFPIAHPAMQRVYKFEWLCKVPGGHDRGNGYSSPGYLSREEREKIIQEWAGHNARYFIGNGLIEYSEDDIMKILVK